MGEGRLAVPARLERMMNLESTIITITGWLDRVNIETAQARFTELQGRSWTGKAPSNSFSSGQLLPLIARHEAAHAVIAHVWGLRVKSILLPETGDGGIIFDADSSDLTESLALTVVDLAGAVPELLEGAQPCRREEIAASSDILAAALDASTCRGLRGGANLTHQCFATIATCNVIARFEEIDRVGSALLAAGELSGAEVATLCGCPQ
jgi:hypothetical protein